MDSEHETYENMNVDSRVIGKRSMVAKYFLISHLTVKGNPTPPLKLRALIWEHLPNSLGVTSVGGLDRD
jgi:hypothetical protein